MATFKHLLVKYDVYQKILQARDNIAESRRRERFLAVVIIQRMTRGYLTRKYVRWLHHNALTIQCAFRQHLARKRFRAALKAYLRALHKRYYEKHATKIQALWRGVLSRRYKFCYKSYRLWLRKVTERGERRIAEAAEFTIRSRIDDLKILEGEARQWLAFVVFKLHHLLRTYCCAGVYSNLGSHEFSEFEKLLSSIKYEEYRKKLKHKYDEFVRKHKPKFSNDRLFPIIGVGKEYWYLTLPEMYEITKLKAPEQNMRFKDTHHGKIHKEPFLWRRAHTPPPVTGRGPYTPRVNKPKIFPDPPAPSMVTGTQNSAGDTEANKDPRFCLYVKYYKPEPQLMDYVDYQINALLRRKNSIENFDILEHGASAACQPSNFAQSKLKEKPND